jgi:hypothetical protein
MSNFVDTTVKEINSRLKELQEEVARLEAARTALVGAAKRGPGRPRGSASAAAAPAAASPAAAAPKPARKRGRPGRPRGRRGGNTRSNQALELVRSSPGITIPKIAEQLKIEPNYLYRVMPKLVSDGLIRRDGLGYFPQGSE